jgi:hypothetical protein
MANEKKKEPRKTEVHYLPVDYDGRCQGTEKVDYVSSFVTFGGTLPEGEVLHKFEMRLPIPDASSCEALDAECKEFFNYSASNMVNKALGKILTDVDELFKAHMFKEVKGENDEVVFLEVPSPTEAGSLYEEARHLHAQNEIDEWRFTPRAVGKTVTVASFIQQLLSTGRVKPDQVEGIETQADLFAKLAELNIL